MKNNETVDNPVAKYATAEASSTADDPVHTAERAID